ncbi:glyoxalase [Flavobacterium covae]|nr:glyoxalase [Flavobacterium covae]QYS90933.1 glyoxalase [Flavobacterium covae]
METRDKNLLILRGEALGNININSSDEELFQNMTIRPILKLQNDLFIQVFINYAIKQKNVFFSLSVEKKLNYIENVIQKDIKFRNSLKGMVIGLFTVDEYMEYIKNSSNLNKRMMSLLIERLKNHVQLLVFNRSIFYCNSSYLAIVF